MADLSFDRLFSANAENDKNTSLSLGVWQGNASISVFSNRAQVARLPVPRTFQVSLKKALQVLLTSKPTDKKSWNFSKWDPETKKSFSIGTFVIGRDDKAIFFIGIAAPDHPPMKFILKSPISFDTSDPMTDVQRSELAVETLIEQLGFDIPMAVSLTSFKRTDTGRATGGAANNNGIRDSDVSIF